MSASLPLRQARTQRSFEGLYREHVNDVYRYAFAVTGNASDAEDVTQTTFMNAFRAFARGERPLKPQNWLLTIAHNVCRQRARLSSRRPREVAFNEELVEGLVPPDNVPSASDIQRALARLPYEQRTTLIMRELEGRSHAEIATILGLTTQATEMLAFRARRALREHLDGSLTCTQAVDALDRESDGQIAPDELGPLRAHLRECPECARVARRLRAQRGAWKALAVTPLPASLRTFGGGGGGAAATGLGVGLATKAAAVTLAAATVGGGALAAKHALAPSAPPRPATTLTARGHHPRHHSARHPAAAAGAQSHVRAKSGKSLSQRATPSPQPQVVASPQPSGTPATSPASPATATAPEVVAPVPAVQLPKARPTHPAHPAHPAHPVRAEHADNGVRRRPIPPATPAAPESHGPPNPPHVHP